MKSWGCQKPSTCFLTWTGALLPFRWGFSSVFDLSLMRQGEQWFPGSCLFWTERRGALSNCVGCVGSLWGETTQQIPYFPSSWHLTWQVTLTYVNSHHFDRELSPSWDFWRPQTWKSTVIWNGLLFWVDCSNIALVDCHWGNIGQMTWVWASCQVFVLVWLASIVWHALVALKMWMTCVCPMMMKFGHWFTESSWWPIVRCLSLPIVSPVLDVLISHSTYAAVCH